MIVGHCPECGRPIQGNGDGTVVSCHHVREPVVLILASLFGQAFDQSRSAAGSESSKEK